MEADRGVLLGVVEKLMNSVKGAKLGVVVWERKEKQCLSGGETAYLARGAENQGPVL